MKTEEKQNGGKRPELATATGSRPRLRWKKNPRPSGLAGVCSGHPGHTLRSGDDKYATAYEHGRYGQKGGWYWTARFDPAVPLKNTCNEQPVTEAEAKAGAMAYVKECLSNAKGEARTDGDD